jgi:hypothetical protein
MKKFMFSAIAMIAFVGSSMAADVAEKKEVVTVENPCKKNFSSALSYAYSLGADDDLAWQYATIAYLFCETRFMGTQPLK